MAVNDWFLYVGDKLNEDQWQPVAVLKWIVTGALVIGREPSDAKRGVSDNRPTPVSLDRLYKEPHK